MCHGCSASSHAALTPARGDPISRPSRNIRKIVPSPAKKFGMRVTASLNATRGCAGDGTPHIERDAVIPDELSRWLLAFPFKNSVSVHVTGSKAIVPSSSVLLPRAMHEAIQRVGLIVPVALRQLRPPSPTPRTPPLRAQGPESILRQMTSASFVVDRRPGAVDLNSETCRFLRRHPLPRRPEQHRQHPRIHQRRPPQSDDAYSVGFSASCFCSRFCTVRPHGFSALIVKTTAPTSSVAITASSAMPPLPKRRSSLCPQEGGAKGRGCQASEAPCLTQSRWRAKIRKAPLQRREQAFAAHE